MIIEEKILTLLHNIPIKWILPGGDYNFYFFFFFFFFIFFFNFLFFLKKNIYYKYDRLYSYILIVNY